MGRMLKALKQIESEAPKTTETEGNRPQNLESSPTDESTKSTAKTLLTDTVIVSKVDDDAPSQNDALSKNDASQNELCEERTQRQVEVPGEEQRIDETIDYLPSEQPVVTNEKESQNLSDGDDADSTSEELSLTVDFHSPKKLVIEPPKNLRETSLYEPDDSDESAEAETADEQTDNESDATNGIEKGSSTSLTTDWKPASYSDYRERIEKLAEEPANLLSQTVNYDRDSHDEHHKDDSHEEESFGETQNQIDDEFPFGRPGSQSKSTVEQTTEETSETSNDANEANDDSETQNVSATVNYNDLDYDNLFGEETNEADATGSEKNSPVVRTLADIKNDLEAAALKEDTFDYDFEKTVESEATDSDSTEEQVADESLAADEPASEAQPTEAQPDPEEVGAEDYRDDDLHPALITESETESDNTSEEAVANTDDSEPAELSPESSADISSENDSKGVNYFTEPQERQSQAIRSKTISGLIESGSYPSFAGDSNEADESAEIAANDTPQVSLDERLSKIMPKPMSLRDSSVHLSRKDLTSESVESAASEVDREEEKEANQVSVAFLNEVGTRRRTEFEERLHEELQNHELLLGYEKLAKKVLADSPNPHASSIYLSGVGKSSGLTSIAMQFAVMMAACSEEKILILDANVIDKSLTGELEEKHKSGFVEALSGHRWLDSIAPTGFPHVHLLPSGRGSLLDEVALPVFQNLLHEANKLYRAVLIIGGSTDDAVTPTLARGCDSCYLVLELGKTEEEDAEQQILELQAHGARMRGTIVG